MKWASLIVVSAWLGVGGMAFAATFNSAPILEGEGIDVFNRAVAREWMSKDLFDDPFATVVFGDVDVYDKFPYLEAHYFEVVSDPNWDRVLYGEVGKGLAAFDGDGSAFGKLNGPRGMAVDEHGRLFVADTDNHRVLVFRAQHEFDRMELVPLYEIGDLSRPYGVGYSDGGTPFAEGDDHLYVADTGSNSVVAFDLTEGGARARSELGGLGSGEGRFAGPMDVTVGREDGAHTSDIYVADAHNHRIVHLRDSGGDLEWVAVRETESEEAGVVTSLDTDQWGNVYSADPMSGRVEKLSARLEPLAELSVGLDRPKNFHIPFANVHDHRDGSVSRVGQGSGVLVESWSSETGLSLMKLGVEIEDLSVSTADGVSAEFLLTDHARVGAEFVDPRDSRVVSSVDLGEFAAGRQKVEFDDERLPAVSGAYLLRLRADSRYEGGAGDERESGILLSLGEGGATFGGPARLQSYPNPFNPRTTVRFSLPAGTSGEFSLRVFDTQGRLVRVLAEGHGSGAREVVWDGRDDRGRDVGSGVYVYRLSAGGTESSSRVVHLK